MNWLIQHCLLGLAVAAGSSSASGTGEQQAPGTPSQAASPAAGSQFPAPVLRVYRDSCVACHDHDGRGEAGRETVPSIPDFTSAVWQSSRNDQDLSRSILEGKSKMPRMKNKLGTVNVTSMVALVRAFRDGKLVVDDEAEPTSLDGKPKPAAAKDAAPGRSVSAPSGASAKSAPQASRLFQRSCAMCHGGDGTGSDARESLASIPNFTIRRWQEERSNARLLVSILDGKGTGMPAFREKLSREQARELVAHIRTFAAGTVGFAPPRTSEFDAQFDALLREYNDLARRLSALSSSEPSKETSSPPSAGPARKK